MSGLKVLDLFSGIGGFSLGLERTGGFETVAFCEIDKKARLVLKKHWPSVPIFEDVATLTGDQINEKIDIIVGGFPCQDISLAGKGAGLAGARSGLWYEYHRLIKEIRPSWVIAENVSALRSRGLDEVLRSLAEIGYDAEWHCIPASAVGAPHRRDRIWIIAYPNSDSKHWGTKSQFSDDSNGETVCNEFGGLRADVAYTASAEQQGDTRGVLRELKRGNTAFRREDIRQTNGKTGSNFFRSNNQIVAHAVREGLEGQLHESGQVERSVSETRFTIFGSDGWVPRADSQWEVEPKVGRVAHGVPGRVDRLKQLGNAVVPQIPELIGRAILASISKPSR